ncbi:DNA mismatch repair protein Msh6 [Strongylocentrotus purpuratus]|uniref:DNA mismatch repair protein n=1 Tax=Strongylocentrotus purpuratus TaxID=7668 RepID=A0A7M7N1W2_STRPU|nr:DNA mismatch repair protein Msh6 [Strongylocentrotus purpuratus]
MATLFSYFSKLPGKKTEKTSPKAGDKAETDKSVSPKENAKEKLSTSPPSKSKSEITNGHQTFAPGDLVWARLEGYPWWPSLVCNHPTLEKCTKKEGRKGLVHVQFFDDPPSRAWISDKFIEGYNGSRAKECQFGCKFHTTKPDVRRGMDQADEALKKDREERMELVVCQVPSEDEEDEEEEEDEMEVEEEASEGSASEEDITIRRRKPRAAAKNAMSTQKKKRRRIRVASDSESSGDEFKPDSDDESEGAVSSGLDEDEISASETESDPETPKKAKKRKRGSTSTVTPSTNKSAKKPRSVLTPFSMDHSDSATPPSKKTFGTPSGQSSMDRPDSATPPSKKTFGTPSAQSSMDRPDSATPTSRKTFGTPSVSSTTKSRLSAFQSPAPSSPSPSPAADSEETRFPHQRQEWLKPGKRKDIKGRPEQDPEYDSSTLFVPKSFMDKTTPAMRQWWEMKSKYYNAVLFFKMGKFYELYHMDAEVAVKELGLIFMKGENAHCGFPEIAFSRYSETLIQKGYRIARVEQTETPDMMQERVKHLSRAPTKFDKVVKREICRISTQATRTFSFIDGDTCEAQSSYLLAVTERPCEGSSGGESVYGVCIVETSIGKFYIGQFQDDRHSSRFRTLIAHYPPAQVLFERGKLLPKTQQLLSNNLVSVLKDSLLPGSEFWDASKTLKALMEKGYFEDSERDKDGQENGEKRGLSCWPDELKEMLSDADSLGLTPKDGCEMALSALGACTWYLKKCCLEQELLSMRNFEVYKPLDVEASKPSSPLPSFTSKQHMVLDSITLSNLDILENSSTGTREGTLLETLDRCRTPFGKRLFKQWLCTPLCNPKSINDRLDAIADLHSNPDIVAEVVELIKKLPDLERLLSKIHTLGSSKRNSDHPDSRAIFFEDAVYSKRKISDFLTALDGFESGLKIVKLFKKSVPDFKSSLLKACISLKSTGCRGKYPDYADTLEFFETAFDQKKAKEKGAIIPCKGVIPEYDNAISDIADTKDRLQEYLDKQKKRLGCRNIVYWGTAKNRFQMEIPESALSRHIPEEYELTSSKKGFKRYWSPTIQNLLADTMNAEDRRDAALKDSMRRVFHKFDEHYKSWDAAIQCLSVLDVLMCLAEYSQSGEGNMCRPDIVLPSENEQPYIAIVEGRHPCIAHTFAGGDYIPNDTFIGIVNDNEMDEGEENHGNSSCILVTGPNMGGKSTLMRQAGLIIVMAQLGCYVPAEGCRLTPVDRVFTRLGARDNILSGESTFFVELSETASILKHASKHSLVLVDELGRGTATYDGTAIATAVVKELSEVVGCRTLFSTHYHSLVEEFSHDPNIRLGHMACMVENENEEDPSQETITFLYKFVGGACPKSYGFNAARLADIPDEIILVARQKAKHFEESAERMKFFRSVHKMCGASSGLDVCKLKQIVARV